MSGSRLRSGIFSQLTTARFLRRYWQRKPLLLRQALPGFVSPVSAEELAGLSLEDCVESRIVIEKGGSGPWELRRGPFTSRSFARLPPKRWTLLVQAVDQWVPEVHALRRHFAFLPPWRFDDIMFSFAVDGGGVGPHYDNYDVFLLQAQGRRLWRIGDPCDAGTPCRDDTELRILRRFVTREEYLLEPGDILYLPPRIAHWGIARGECITCSVGFRAPSHADILLDFASEAAQRSGDDQRYTDPPIAPHDADGRISDAAVRRVQGILRTLSTDPDAVRDWLGRTMTERKYPDLDIAPETPPRTRLRAGLALQRHPASRFAWSGSGEQAELFVDGERFVCDESLARLLAGAADLQPEVLEPFLHDRAAKTVVGALIASGALLQR